jgi:hypothetical protein
MRNTYINKATIKNVVLNESLAYENDLLMNRVWYTADASLIEQLFKKYQNGTDTVSSGRFWAAVPVAGLAIRKIHSGLPQMIVNTLTDLVVSDMNNVKVTSDADVITEAQQEVWDKIAEISDFNELVHECIQDVLVDGDGCFKIKYDSEESQYPILDFASGDDVEYEYIGKKLVAVKFKTIYTHKNKEYELIERYSKGRIDYNLYCKTKEVPLSTIPETADLPAYVEFTKPLMLAVPVLFFKSTKYKNRGKSIYDGKTEAFDAYDEAISAWRDAERDGRSKNYIPEDLVPRDANGGELLRPNPFQFRYITLNGGINLDDSKIQTQSADIDYAAHQAAIAQTLDLCLQGIISPATLGINVGAEASGESQKQKKDMTAITRNHITNKLEKAIKKLVKTALDFYNYIVSNTEYNIDVDFSFGEYGALDFGSKLQMLSSAVPGQSIMSIETVVDELWGDSKDDEWKAQEVARLKEGDAMYEEVPFPNDSSLISTNEKATEPTLKEE